MNKAPANISMRLFSYLFIVIVGLMIANKVLNLHLHKMENGSIVAHAHPFEKSDGSTPYESHQHTDTELLLIQSFTTFLYTGAIVLSLGLGLHLFTINLLTGRSGKISLAYLESIEDRGPPLSYSL